MVLESEQTQEKNAGLVLVNAISLSWTLAYIRVHNNAIFQANHFVFWQCYISGVLQDDYRYVQLYVL